jgi:hypothetical protein
MEPGVTISPTIKKSLITTTTNIKRFHHELFLVFQPLEATNSIISQFQIPFMQPGHQFCEMLEDPFFPSLASPSGQSSLSLRRRRLQHPIFLLTRDYSKMNSARTHLLRTRRADVLAYYRISSQLIHAARSLS